MNRVVALSVVLAAGLRAQSPDAERFEKKVRPLLASKCYSCHGEKVKMAGLSLSSPEGLAHATASGIIAKGDTANSRILHALSYTDKVKMPPSGKLSTDEVAVIRTWIEGGAHWPETTTVRSPERKGVTDDDRRHWAFQPIRKPTSPVLKKVAGVRNPIDQFILAKLEEKGLVPPAPADKLTLLRRVTFDLTGLPPTSQEIDTFVNDKSPEAFAKVVDRLLASPRYGERWGRHWLDVARYADSTGMDEDNLYPHAWRYRDYVVEAFNDDLPFDRFIRQQLAGDLLPAKDAEERARNVIATGFLAIGPRPLAQQDRLQAVYDIVDEQIDTTSKAFLGLTVACARCHDHKFDPIPTKDYYGLASIFASTTQFRNQGRPGSISYMYYTPLDPAAYDRYQAHRWRTLAKQAEMEDALSEDSGRENANLRPKLRDYLVAAWKTRSQGIAVDAAAAEANLEHARLQAFVAWINSRDQKAKDTYLKDLLSATDSTIEAVTTSYQDHYSKAALKWDDQLERWRLRLAREGLQDRDLQEKPKFETEEDPFFAAVTFDGGPMDVAESPRVQFLRKEWKLLQDTSPETPALASAVADGPVVEQRVFSRGSYQAPGEPVSKHFPVVIAGDDQKPVSNGSGRLELANWLASPENPLTARVIVNRIWQWHFGDGLVRTPNNWGKTGEAPTHPELLDYLATRFIESGWSIKALHREILLSNTYQMSSAASPQTRDADPGNRLWSRFNRLRLSAEQLRDSLLAIDGSLDSTMGGSLFPTGKSKREKIDVEELKRRSLYMPVRRGNIPSLFSTFDFGDATTSSDGRTRTNVAPQALFLMNSKFVVERSRGLAGGLLTRTELSDTDRIRTAYLTVLGRPPDSAETDAGLTYIANLRTRLGTPDANSAAWTSFCHVLLATNEFLYIE